MQEIEAHKGVSSAWTMFEDSGLNGKRIFFKMRQSPWEFIIFARVCIISEKLFPESKLLKDIGLA